MVPAAFISHACEILGDTKGGLSGAEIARYLSKYASDYDVDIPYPTCPFPQKSAPNKRTALYKNLRKFVPQQQVQILVGLCGLAKLKDNSAVNDLRYKIMLRYGDVLERLPGSEIDAALVQEARHWLAGFPASLRLYDAALTKLGNTCFQRNVLDDPRLSLEKLTQTLLSNEKSLENQIAGLGQFLKGRGCSNELGNMFQKLIDYYTKYQNEYVKHDDAVTENEVEIILEMTNAHSCVS